MIVAQEIIDQYQIRECRACKALIANDRKYGRLPNFKDTTLCECCENKNDRWRFVKLDMEIDSNQESIKDLSNGD